MALWGVSNLVRLLLAMGGGYGASAGLTAFAAIALPTIKSLPRSEAVVLASMLAFLVCLALLIWAFAERSLCRLCLVMTGAGTGGRGCCFGLACPFA